MGKGTRRIIAVAVAVALGVAGCSGDDAEADGDTSVITDPVDTSDSTTSSTTTEATTTTEDPDAAVKAEVEEAYLAYWDAYIEIFEAPNPENPLIEQHTAEAVRQATQDGITRYLLEGQSLRRPENGDHFQVTVLDVDPTARRAYLSVCVVDGLQIIDNATSTVINDHVASKLARAEAILEDGVWKVAQSRILERRDGVWDCT